MSDSINCLIADEISTSQIVDGHTPDIDLRGFEPADLKPFKIGIDLAWCHHKMPDSTPTPRFIIPLGDDNDPPAYNAVLTPDGRKSFKWAMDNKIKWADKCLTAGSKLVFNPDALNQDIAPVTEGEFDALAIMKATNYALKVAALGGAGNTPDIVKRLSKMPVKPHVVMIFDNDSGKDEAARVMKKLAETGTAAISVLLDDYMSGDDKKVFAGKKIDANAILQTLGCQYLNNLITKVITDVADKLDQIADELETQKLFAQAEKNSKPKLTKKRSTEIDALIEKINSQVTEQQLIDAGFLIKTKTDYACPWCGSGTGNNHTGALKFFPDGGGVACNKCHCGGSTLTFIAQMTNADTNGKAYIDFIRDTADQFNVSYDPSIFERKNSSVDVQDDAVVAWQKVNGSIDPDIYLEIREAETFLLNITADTLTADVARASTTAHRLALCSFYDFANAAVDNFFDAFEHAKSTAKSIVDDAKSTGSTVPTAIKTLAKLTDRQIQTDINRHETRIRKAHLKRQTKLSDKAESDRKKVRADKQLEADQNALGKGYKLKSSEQADYLLNQPDDDTGRADQFAFIFGDKIRFISQREQWLIFERDKDFKSAGIWRLGNPARNTIVMPFASEMHKFLVANATSNNTTPDFDKQIEHWRNLKCMTNAVRLAGSSKSNIQISPEDLDRNPNLLLCRNGVIDLQTKDFFPNVKKAWLITKRCNVIYNPKVNEEFVRKFLADIQPNRDTLEAMLRWLGYCITGEISQQKMHFWKGGGANAKSTLLAVLRYLLDTYAVNIPSELICLNNSPTNANNATPAIAMLNGVRLAISSELRHDARLNAPMVKDLSSGEVMPMRLLHCNFENFKPICKLIICGNFYPQLVNVNDKGLLRRLQTIEFKQTFEGDKADLQMPKKLMLADNLSAMFNLLVNAAFDFYREGKLLTSEEMTLSRQAYINANDFIAQFVEEYCVLGDDKFVMRKDLINKIKDVYPVECKFLKNEKELEKFIEVKYVTSKRKTGKGIEYSGIGLIDSLPRGNHSSNNFSGNGNTPPI